MISHQGAAGLLTATLTSLWVGGLFAIGVANLTRWRPMGVTARGRLWTLALAVTISAPLIHWPRSGAPYSRAESARRDIGAGATLSEQPVEGAVLPAEESSPASLTPRPVSVVRSAESASVPLDPAVGTTVLGIWLAGSLVGLSWLFIQVARLVAIKRASYPPDGSLSTAWAEVYRPRGRRQIQLLVTDRAWLPAACGYFRPAVIAPEALCRQLGGDETRHLLSHELAHLNRNDDWWLLLHRLIQALLWWHPVIWYVSRKLDAEREIACDEMVARDSSRRAYARTLVRVAEVAKGTMVQLAPGILRGELTRRIELLLGISTPVKPSSRVRAGAVAASTFALALWLSPPALRPGIHQWPTGDESVARRTLAVHLDSLFTVYVDSGFSGSILLAMGNEVILAQGYGMADRDRGIAATAETRYSVAGFTKMFTAAAILALEDEGRLRVTDSLGTFFGPLPGTADQVTLHQLLTHTDGLTRQNAPVYRTDAQSFIQAVSATADSFAPGEGYRYNDFGHSILGIVVERITGVPYESFIRDRFLRPAGLARTGFENERDQKLATEYAGSAGAQYPIPERSYTWGRRASLGMVSTITDMYRWVNAIQDSRVIPEGVKERMFQVHGPTDWGAERGYGWDRIRLRDGSRIWRRVAGTPGMEGEILHDPARGWTAIILVNSRVEWRFKVWDDIVGAISRSESSANPP